MRKLIAHFAALAVACVFASLPTLARVHDRLSPYDNVSSFRPSKNLERPHEKIAASTLDATPAHRTPLPIPALTQDVVLPSSLAVSDAAVSALASRAPPVR